jgi:hypothetical protein
VELNFVELVKNTDGKCKKLPNQLHLGDKFKAKEFELFNAKFYRIEAENKEINIPTDYFRVIF